MTHPDDARSDDNRTEDSPGGAGETGALAAASQEGSGGTDPLGPLNRVTEDDGE